jgi:hypothetical protein
MGVNGKSKGNGFERKIANVLSERFKEHTGLEQSFRRNIDSGSFFGGGNQFRTQTHDLSKASFGDIVTPPGFKYSIECKFYKTAPGIKSLLNQDIKQWDEWLKQAEQDCTNSNQEMALIIKYNNVEEIVLLDNQKLTAKLAQALINNDLPLRYKNYVIITLSHFLSLPNSFFF